MNTESTEEKQGLQQDVNSESTDAVKTKEVKSKRKRRGVGSARGTNRLKFSNTDAKTNGLFLGHLDTVEVKDIEISEESTGMPSFNGLSIPKIVFTFTSNEADVVKRKYVSLQFNAVESNVNTIPGGKEEWKVNQIFDYVKHFLNVYLLKGRELTEAEETMLSLDIEDFDEDGSYLNVEPEEVISAWRSLFENMVTLFNQGKDDKPIYKNKDGKPLTVWLKLLRYFKTRKNVWKPVNNGDLAFSSFAGEGVIELYTANTIPAIKVDVIREDINPRVIKENKTPNMPSMPNMAMGASPIIDTNAQGGADMGQMVDSNFEDVPF